MKSLIGYAPPLIAFLAMFVGLLGPGRSADRTGLRAITPFGWISCAIAAVSLGVAVYMQRAKNAELAAALASKQQMQTAVFRELQASLDSMRDVLRHAALMPYVANAEVADGAPAKLPFKKYADSQESQCTRDLPVNLLLSDRQKIKKDRQADDSATIMTFGLQ